MAEYLTVPTDDLPAEGARAEPAEVEAYMAAMEADGWRYVAPWLERHKSDAGDHWRTLMVFRREVPGGP